jgi:predicted Rdx family selenoprotein
VSAEITGKTGDKVELIGGGGGIFEIRRDGEVIWEKQHSGHFPEPGEAARLFDVKGSG